jgi:hypothetical protein
LALVPLAVMPTALGLPRLRPLAITGCPFQFSFQLQQTPQGQ